MSDIDKQPQAGSEVSNEPETPKPSDNGMTVEFLAKELKEARAEAASNRVKRKELERQIAAQEKKQLEEQGKFQELYQQSKSELDKQREELERGDKYKMAFEATVKRRIEALPEATRSLVPDYDDPIMLSNWLDANWKLLSNQKFPNLDAGAGSTTTASGGNGSAAISPLAAEVAKHLNLSEEAKQRLYKGK